LSRLVPAGLHATIVLLRHGESVAITEGRFQGRLDTPLSPLGERQAELAGERLAHPGRPPQIPVPSSAPVEIAHSPLDRTRATAAAAAAALRSVYGLETPAPRPEPGLFEIGQGAWEGLERPEVEARYGAELQAWREAPHLNNAPGGEALVEADRRVRLALPAMVARLTNASAQAEAPLGSASGYPPPVTSPAWTLLVGHDGVFKLVLLALLELPLERFWTFAFGLTGITILAIHDGQVVVRAHNLLDHLGPLQAETATLDAAEADVGVQREAAGAL
jgi:broad specificity phosphatase PhoE